MIALGNRLVNGRVVLELVPFQHRDLVKEIGKNTSGHPRNASADDDVTQAIINLLIAAELTLAAAQLTPAYDHMARKTPPSVDDERLVAGFLAQGVRE